MIQRVQKRATTHFARCRRLHPPLTLVLVCLSSCAIDVASAKPWFDLANFFRSPSSQHLVNGPSHSDQAKRSAGSHLTSERFAIARRGGVDDASAFRLRKRGHSTLNSPVESEQLPSVKEADGRSGGILLTSLGSAISLPLHYYATMLSHANSSMKRSELGLVRRSAQAALMLREKNGDSPSFRLRKRSGQNVQQPSPRGKSG